MKLPDDMNTRSLRRIGEHFTVEPMSALTDPNKLICNHCAVAKCNIRSAVKRVPHDKAVLKVQSCGEFLPTLGFSVLQGLEGPHWNTFRVGGAWANRLTSGMKVAVADTRAGKIVRTMRVDRVHSGRLKDMLAAHAHQNHAIISEIEDNELHEHKAGARLLRILKNAYGTNIASEDRVASVIYLMTDHA